jgi:hypothetical protein
VPPLAITEAGVRSATEHAERLVMEGKIKQ